MYIKRNYFNQEWNDFFLSWPNLDLNHEPLTYKARIMHLDDDNLWWKWAMKICGYGNVYIVQYSSIGCCMGILKILW